MFSIQVKVQRVLVATNASSVVNQVIGPETAQATDVHVTLQRFVLEHTPYMFTAPNPFISKSHSAPSAYGSAWCEQPVNWPCSRCQ